MAIGSLAIRSYLSPVLFGAKKKADSSKPATVKPMLAVNVNFDKLKFPVIISPKLDGLRGMVKDGQLMSRSLLPVPNKIAQEILSKFEGLDGELICGNPTDENVLQESNAFFMSEDGESDNWAFYIFDRWDQPDKPFSERFESLKKMDLPPQIKVVPHITVNSLAELLDWEKKFLDEGYEGLMMRKPDGGYKNGRSTVKEALLLKLKRFVDGEAKIVDFEELMHNENPARVNNVGKLVRSKNKNNMKPMNALGAFIVEDTKTGVRFTLGNGLTNEEREKFWQDKEQYLGKTVKYKHFPKGVVTKPRHAEFLGFRDERDMSED